MLDIVITHYREDYGTGEKLFRMIGLQRCVNFDDIRVTVVNDGGHRLPEEKLKELPYRVEQLDIPHGGVSAARNAGIENAKGEWIMFCDFDDNFASVFSLREIMSVISTDKYDMLWSRIMAEDYLDGKENLFYVPDKQRFVFCHGKVYRTAFLKENDVTFDTRLVFNEDSCFNAVIIARTPYWRIGEIKSPIPLYVWIRRPQSVTNSGREDEATYGHFRRNMIVTAEYGKGDERYYGMVTRSVYDAFYMIHGVRNSPQMKRRIMDEFAPWIAEREDAYGKVPADIMGEIRRVSRSELVDPGQETADDPETVEKWMKKTIQVYRGTQEESGCANEDI